MTSTVKEWTCLLDPGRVCSDRHPGLGDCRSSCAFARLPPLQVLLRRFLRKMTVSHPCHPCPAQASRRRICRALVRRNPRRRYELKGFAWVAVQEIVPPLGSLGFCRTLLSPSSRCRIARSANSWTSRRWGRQHLSSSRRRTGIRGWSGSSWR